MAYELTDIWCRSCLPLAEIAQRLGLVDVSEDAENDWEWVIGTLAGVRLDITRPQTRAAGAVNTRIFALDGEFTESLLSVLFSHLETFVPGSIACGRWEYRTGNDFDLVVVQEFGRANVGGTAESECGP